MPDKLAKAALSLKPNLVKTFRRKRGEVREDGKVFWSLDKSSQGGGRWLSSTIFDSYVKKVKERGRKRYLNNPEKSVENSRKWRKKNLQKYQENNRTYYNANREKILNLSKKNSKTNVKKRAVYQREWRSLNTPKLREYYRNYSKKRRVADPVFSLSVLLRMYISRALKAQSFSKSSKLKNCLGCSLPELKTWIENQFLPDMAWDNRGKWHVDHIVPLALAQSSDEVYALNHYTNLRPLWAFDNLSKNKALPKQLPEFSHPSIQKIYQQAKNNPRNPEL